MIATVIELKEVHLTHKIRSPGFSILPLTFGEVLVPGLGFLKQKEKIALGWIIATHILLL